MKVESWFVRIMVYDYEYSPRTRWVNVPVSDEARGRSLLTEFEGYMNKLTYTEIQDVSGIWCAAHNIDGFIQQVDGLYKQVREKIA